MSSKVLQCTLVDVSFDGVKDWVMMGMIAWELFISCSIMIGCLWQMPKSINRSCQALALYSIKALLWRQAQSLLVVGASLGSVGGAAAS